MHLEKFEVDKIQNGRLSAIIHLGRPDIVEYYENRSRYLHHYQGLTQTFLSSGPQDHQLRESGGPTIFLVVLRIKSRHTNSYAYIIKKWVG